MAGQVADPACSVAVDCASSIGQFQSPAARQLEASNQIVAIHKFAHFSLVASACLWRASKHAEACRHWMSWPRRTGE
eukprot:5866208-Pyramimonas_sp.AAC.1